MGKEPKTGRKRMTEKALAANRANGPKGGRPPGKMNTEKIALRDRIRLREKEIVDHMFHLAFHGDIQLGAMHGLLDRGWGRPVQPHDGDGQGGPITMLVVTGVPEHDPEYGNWQYEPGEPKPVTRLLPVAPRG